MCTFNMPPASNLMDCLASSDDYAKPEKHPLSPISPFIATQPNGSPPLNVSSAGGYKISTATIKSLVQTMDENEVLQKFLGTAPPTPPKCL